MRALRDSQDPVGFSRELWKEMADLGWLGIPFAEAHGGADLGLTELALVIESLGRNLAPEPFLSTILMAGGALELAGSDEQRAAWLPKIIEGQVIATLATQEPGSRYALTQVTTRAEKAGDGWRLSGTKAQVLDGHVADLLIVPARTEGADGDREGISLFLVESGAAGLTVERQHRVDERGAATVVLEGVEVGGDALLGALGAGATYLESVVDRATVGLCAEMLGGMSAAFEATVEYLKQREQFGTVIGTFQALKHRAARMFIEVELSRGAVMAATRALDAGDADAAKLVSLAKARCSDAYMLVANEGVQIYAGVGMTDEYDIGLYLKRARAAQLSFGDAAYHRRRWAELAEY